MIVSINQPAYLPWIGYFHRIAQADVHIVLDHVQFEKNSFTNRNKVRTAQGWTWLTVPVATKGHFGDLPINKLQIARDERWRSKHWQTIRFNYSRSPHFGEYSAFFEETYSSEWGRLDDLMEHINTYVLRHALRIPTRIVRSSELSVTGTKSELVLNLCRAVGADTYLSGPLGRDYLDELHFRDAGITIRYHDYVHPVYPQIHGGFEPYMAIIDLLFNCGTRSAAIMGAIN